MCESEAIVRPTIRRTVRRVTASNQVG